MREKTFKRYTMDEYSAYLISFTSKVRFSEVHVHHTYIPTIRDFRSQTYKDKLIRAMWRYHTETRGWSDIGQHVTIDPDGYIWEGRPLTEPPASATGYNDSDADYIHPFMFEMIGNFDIGHDKLEGRQLQTALQLTATLLAQWDLPLDNIRFHREMTSYKSCPGTGVDKETFAAQVNQTLSKLKGGTSMPTPSAPNAEFPVITERIRVILDETNVLDSYLIEGSTYVPLRQLAETFGAKVEWNTESQTAIVHKEGDS